MNVDQCGDKIEGIIERIKKLKYKFNDENKENEADKVKDEVISLLEEWLEMVVSDNEVAESLAENEEKPEELD